MSPNEHAGLVAELFKSATELPPQDRQAFVEDYCRFNADLRGEVESLLQTHERAEKFMDRPAVDLAAETLAYTGAFAVGEIIGDYEIISLIGRGGMGEVYVAQDRQLQRRVALKLVRRGMDTEQIVRQFLHEQRLLASLNHPNISQLYDAGVTPDGIPFFAMEQVDGTRIDDYCREKNLSIQQRLELFAKVCAAVHYAHQHLVVHRDIKPSNILVTPEGEPKLLDFGIAKMLDAVTNIAPEQTITLQNVLTPEYASPEHVRGEPITTASDVYSLGVLLYELLTGTKPYRIATRAPAEIARIITEKEPTKPSTAIRESRSGNQDSTDSRFTIQDSRALRGDLDNIVLLAMRKEPQRRYSSVSQLAADIRRHLDGLPVRARKDTFAYRSSKFVRRHRVGVAAAALILLTLLAGIAATLAQARRAEQQRARAEKRFNDVRKLANSLVSEIMPKFVFVPGTSEAHEIATKRAFEYLDNLARESENDTGLQHELAVAYSSLALQMEMAHGDSKESVECARKALALHEALLKKQPNDPTLRDETARNYESVGYGLMLTATQDESLENFARALAIREPLLASHPESFDFRYRLAHLHMSIGELFNRSGKPDEGLQHYQTAFALIDPLRQHRDEPRNHLRLQRGFASCENGMARVFVERADTGAALQHYQAAHAIIEPMFDTTPNDIIAWQLLSETTSGEAELLSKLERYKEAQEKLRRCLRILESSPDNEPTVRYYVARLYSQLGAALTAADDLLAAITELKKASQIEQEFVAHGIDNLMYAEDRATTFERLGSAKWKATDYPAALQSYEHALALRERNAKDPKSERAQKSLAACRAQIAALKSEIR